MKKKVLFVVDEKKMGGVSILLEDMLNLFDYSKYQIDVLVLHNNGECLNNVNKNVRILFGTNFFKTIDLPIKEVIKSRNIKNIINKLYLIFLMKTCLIKNKIIKERKKILSEKYDVEIAFKDGFTAIFTAFGDSSKKIHWLHYEYKKTNPNAKYDKLFKTILPTFDKIVAVSDGVKNYFNDIYHLEDKTIVIYNYVNGERILKKSNEKNIKKKSNNKINLISVGRIHPQKGYDRLIEAISYLSEEEKSRISLEIYGDGPDFSKCVNLIKKYKLEKIVDLKGAVINPYQFMKCKDLFILSSIYEPFGLVIVESMILKVPVMACSNSATSRLIKNNYNGLIVDNSMNGIINGLKFIINNLDELKKYKKNLDNYVYDNQDIVKKIKEVIG